MTIDVIDAHGDIQTIPTLADLVAALGVTRFFCGVAGSPIVRPANSAAYLVDDRIANAAGSLGVVSLADLLDQPFTVEAIALSTDDSGVAAVQATVELLLYDADASGGAGDNQPYSRSRANFVGRYAGAFTSNVGYFSDGAVARLLPSDGGNRIILKPGAGGVSLWYDLKTLSAFTPSANGTSFVPTFEGFFGRV